MPLSISEQEKKKITSERKIRGGFIFERTLSCVAEKKMPCAAAIRKKNAQVF